ncbi:MAG: hypothetical protein ACRDT8_11210 [Micromonosporaceae bacterium]
MSQTAHEIAMDLSDLRHASREYLPGVADAYLDANRAVAATADVSTGDTRVMKHWNALRDEFQRILGTNSNRFVDICDALEKVVDLWCATDEAAADELKKLTANSSTKAVREPRHDDLPAPVMPEPKE